MVGVVSLIFLVSVIGNIGERLPMEVGNWVKETKIQCFTPETLYDYIDGEADQYMPYEFKLLTVVNYENKENAEERIEVQLYEMSSTLNAFGIFSVHRDPNKKIFLCGNDGVIGGNQAMFYQARYFVKLLASNSSITSEQVLLVGKKVSEVLPKEKLEVQELECLELDAKVQNTERYLAKDVLSQTFFPKGFVVQLKVGGKVGSGFIVVYGGTDKAKEGWNEYIAYLKDLGADYTLVGGSLMVMSPVSEMCVASLLDREIVGVWVPGGDLEEMRALADKIVGCIKERQGSVESNSNK